MADDVAKMLAEVTAREKIRELGARYCWFVSRADADGVASLYTPDGSFTYSLGGKFYTDSGAKAIRASIAEKLKPGVVFPVTHNHVIIVNGDTATSTCSMHAKTHNPQLPDFAGYYHDKYRVHDGKWKFAERRYFRYWDGFERSGLDVEGKPETGMSAIHS